MALSPKLQVLADSALDSEDGLCQIGHSLPDLKKVVIYLTSKMPLDHLLVRISCTDHVTELVEELSTVQYSAQQISIAIEDLIEDGHLRRFEYDMQTAIADWYWSKIFTEYLARPDIPRAWETIRRAYRGYLKQPADRHQGFGQTSYGGANYLAASEKTLHKFCRHLYDELFERGWVQEITDDHVPFGFRRSDAIWPAGTSMAYQLEDFANKSVDRFGRDSQKLIQIARYFKEKEKSKKRRRKSRRISEIEGE